ncbi:MAG: M48 family metallopeptidase [Elusimicrobiota bacterium]
MNEIGKRAYVEMGGMKIPYETVKSKKAKAVRIDINIKRMRVTIPYKGSIDVLDFMERKRDWIISKWNKIEKLRERIPKRQFKVNAKWPYKGKKKTLSVKNGKINYIQNGEIVLSKERVKKNGIKIELEKLYRLEARKYLTEIADKWCREFRVRYKKIYIKNQKTRWGSCSSKGNLNFNWRLIMANPDISEYVTAHEVAHLIENNHGRKFWKILSKYYDDIGEKNKWLKENSPRLIFTENDLL